MDLLGHINVQEMLGDLMVTTFLILLAASAAVVSLMALLPLINCAFEKRFKPKEEARHYDALSQRHELWQTGRSWLDLRVNFLAPDTRTDSQAMSDPTASPARVGTLPSFSSAAAGVLNHATLLIKRTTTARPKDRNVIVPRKPTFCTGEMTQLPAQPSNEVELIRQRPRAA